MVHVVSLVLCRQPQHVIESDVRRMSYGSASGSRRFAMRDTTISSTGAAKGACMEDLDGSDGFQGHIYENTGLKRAGLFHKIH